MGLDIELAKMWSINFAESVVILIGLEINGRRPLLEKQKGFQSNEMKI